MYFLSANVIIYCVEAHNHLSRYLRVNFLLCLTRVRKYMCHLLLILPQCILLYLALAGGKVNLNRILFHVFIVLLVYHHALWRHKSSCSQLKYLLSWVSICILCNLLWRWAFCVSQISLALLAAQILPVFSWLWDLRQALLRILIYRVWHYSVVTRLCWYLLLGFRWTNMVLIATQYSFLIYLHLKAFLGHFRGCYFNLGRFDNLTYILLGLFNGINILWALFSSWVICLVY